MTISKELQSFRNDFLNACAFNSDDHDLLRKYITDGIEKFGEDFFDKDDGLYQGSNPQKLRKRLNLNFSKEKSDRLLEYYKNVSEQNFGGNTSSNNNNDKPNNYYKKILTITILGVVIIGFITWLFFRYCNNCFSSIVVV